MDFSSPQIISVALLGFFSFFSVLTPVKYIVVYMSLTYGISKSEQNAIANKSMFIAFITLVISMVIGEYIFKFLQIELYAFKIAGGTLLVMNGVNMIFGQNIEAPNSQKVKEVKDDFAVFPLGIPIITGPGAISTAILLYAQQPNYTLKFVLFLTIVANFALIYFLVQISHVVSKRLNKSILNILYRLCGILLSSLAIDIVISGFKESGLF